MNMRFFKIEPEAYETARLSLDTARGLVAPETVCEPLATARRTLQDGHVLIGVRAEHANAEDIAAAIAALVQSGQAVELEGIHSHGDLIEGGFITAPNMEGSN